MSDVSSSNNALRESPGLRMGRLFGLAILGVVLALELLAVSLVYKHNFVFECRAMAPAAFCGFLSGAVIRAIAVAGVTTLFLFARPAILATLLNGARRNIEWLWGGVHVAGVALVFLPWMFLSDSSSEATFWAAVLIWLVGAFGAGLGAALLMVPKATWARMAAQAGIGFFLVAAVASLAPELAMGFQFAWRWQLITDVTFFAVEFALTGFGYSVESDPSIHLLGISEFVVLVGRQCSGIEGFLLIGSFLSFYVWLFRSELRFPHVWMLLPIGIVISWCFNVVRITMLILIGHHVSPDLAINGFHSHAGWLMFTLLAVGLAVTAHSLSYFRTTTGETVEAAPRPELLPFRDDPSVAQIFPFIVFMASALLASTFFAVPGVVYPLRFLAMVAGLWVAWRFLSQLEWRLDPVALGSGVAIGVAWVATAAPYDPEGDLAIALTQMSAPILAIWVITRVLGTTILVPVIEELFFRGYVFRRLDSGGTAMRPFALAVSVGLFATLHDRWLAAAIAAVIFALVLLRKGRLSDAILCHAAANGVIAAWAVATQQWSVI